MHCSSSMLLCGSSTRGFPIFCGSMPTKKQGTSFLFFSQSKYLHNQNLPMICWQSCVPNMLSFSSHLIATRAPYLPKDTGMGFIGAGCVQPNSITSGDRTLIARARLRLIFSPTLPIVRAEWSLKGLPSIASRSLRLSAWKTVRCTSFWISWDFAWFNTAETTTSVRLWNFLFRATKSVSQLISANAAWHPSTVTVIRPWLVLRFFSLAAWVQPYCCACSLSHFSA